MEQLPSNFQQLIEILDEILLELQFANWLAYLEGREFASEEENKKGYVDLRGRFEEWVLAPVS